jgi:hypothetical protein
MEFLILEGKNSRGRRNFKLKLTVIKSWQYTGKNPQKDVSH